jgi:hypothetical protein
MSQVFIAGRGLPVNHAVRHVGIVYKHMDVG